MNEGVFWPPDKTYKYGEDFFEYTTITSDDGHEYLEVAITFEHNDRSKETEVLTILKDLGEEAAMCMQDTDPSNYQWAYLDYGKLVDVRFYVNEE